MTWAQIAKVYLSVLALLLAGCTATAPPAPAGISATPFPTVSPPAFVTDPAEAAIPQLIATERTASIAGDRALLAELWAPEARIVDSRGTPDQGNDYIWSGRPAILDRYTIAVFPAPPPAFTTPPAPTITASGDTATAELGHDHWQFVRRDGRWWITELAY